MDEYYFISFENTSTALKAEGYLKENGFNITMMPTPREVTESCGLSIRVNSGGITELRQLVDEDKVKIKGIYHFKKENGTRKIIKVD